MVHSQKRKLGVIFFIRKNLLSPEFKVQVDYNHLIQVVQEAVVKRCNEEKVTVESTERWYVNLCAWLCSWKIFLSSRI